MRILFYTPDWGNRWIPYLKEELKQYDTHFTHDINDAIGLAYMADILISGWMDNVVDYWTKNFPEKKIISWCRRYELFQYKIDTSKIDDLIFVSPFWADYFDKNFKSPARKWIIPNGIDVSEFKLKNHTETKKIAMVCQLRGIKNIPLALQIIKELPEYTLHHIGLPGENMDYLYPYIEHLGLKVSFEGQADVKEWLQDKEFILSTSINEGCPNNILEAMAMGIKPVIHNWPGAKEQFPYMNVFDTVDEAVNIIKEKHYKPELYRKIVAEDYSLENLKQIHKVIDYANA